MTKYEEINEKLSNPSDNMYYIKQNSSYTVNDFERTLYTYTNDSNTLLGIVAVSNNDVVYRIMSNNSDNLDYFKNNQLDYIKEMLNNISPIKSLRVVCCGINKDEINNDEISLLNNTFRFYKDKKIDFNIEFNESWYILIESNGKIGYADNELMEEYKKENIKNSDFSRKI